MSVFVPPARARARRPSAAVAAISVLASAGYLLANLLPAFLDAVRTGLGLSAAAAGALGTAVLLGSALAGAVVTRAAGRSGRARLARIGLLLMVGGFAVAAVTGATWLAVAGSIVGGAGGGMALTVATAAMAATPDPARTSGVALLAVALSGTVLYALVPLLGGGRGATVGLMAAVGLGALLMVRHLPASAASADPAGKDPDPAPHRTAGLLLTTAVGVRSVAMNAVWAIAAGVGTDRVGLSAGTVRALCAACLLAGVVGVVVAGSAGRGRARTTPLVAAVCAGGLAALTMTLAPAGGVALYAVGLLGWNASCQAVTTYVLGVAAVLDGRGRWGALAMAANTFGAACGPIVGLSALAAFGAPATGALIALTAVLCAVPIGRAAHTADALSRPTPPITGAAPAPLRTRPTGRFIPAQRTPGTVSGTLPAGAPPHATPHAPPHATSRPSRRPPRRPKSRASARGTAGVGRPPGAPTLATPARQDGRHGEDKQRW
ncbi:MFS transporter [Embleya sp. NBC_00896]|uniref:MFS transporter n=1 Tax=Embleya sp. NBC_00896 TaxID=2975961 RepID=UPI003864D2EC|nr:MFS transporter [Embleya sp. NBC_00896]